MPELYIGLMSGTSLDGADAVLVDLADGVKHLGHSHLAFAPALRTELLALNAAGDNELERAARAANALAHHYASTVQALLAQCPVDHVIALGAHGQTVRHCPRDGYTLQLLNGALLAELASIDVVCDFRSRDIAAGGEGAPLVPAFHQAVFADRTAHRVIVNIGGIANLTDLPPAGAVSGFDCGPGNLLLDAWVQLHRNQPFDRDGAWAQSGQVLPLLLEKLRSDAFFARTPPKSSGRDLFNLDWLRQQLAGDENAADVQATLLALTATTIADAIGKFCNGAGEIFLCGGGARNGALQRALSQRLPRCRLATTDTLGIHAEHVEAAAFAWLAQRALRSQPGNLPAVTGARGPRILGAIYRA
jgi:anhydro-N-acetylmuramic acid kinase